MMLGRQLLHLSKNKVKQKKINIKMKKIQTIDINCPNCGAPIDIRDLVSNKVQCSHCKSSVVLKNLPRSKRKKVNQKSAELTETSEDRAKKINLSNNWASASLILGGISIVGLLLPIFCFPVNIVGLVAGIAGRHSSKMGQAAIGIILNSIALLFNILFTVITLTSGDPQA